MLNNVKHLLFSCLRTPVERTHPATTTRNVSQDLQTRDIAVCALLASGAKTATKVLVLPKKGLKRPITFLIECLLVNFIKSLA